MTFTFSIRTALKESWATFTRHPWFFMTLSLVMVLLNILNRKNDDKIVAVLITLVAFIWSYVWLSVSLAGADNNGALLTFTSLHKHFPNVREFLLLLAVTIITSLITIFGLVALIIPGLYFLVRLTFANLAYVDRKKGVKDAISHSWHLVSGRRFWTVFLAMVVMVGLIILGAIAVVIGLLLTYPIAMIFQARLYRALNAQQHPGEVVAHPEELPEHTA